MSFTAYIMIGISSLLYGYNSQHCDSNEVHCFDPKIHLVSISREDAMTFLDSQHTRIKRFNQQCNTNEHYCEHNKQSCMQHNENSREYFCGKSNPCTADKTCYLSTPCPAHYHLGCSDNPCDGIPCQNLGTCTKEASGYRCSCFLGFDEQNDCEIDCKPGPADVVFLLDTSMSNINLFNESRDAVYNIVRQLPVNDTDYRIAVITYSHHPTVQFVFNQHLTNETVLSAIENIVKPENGPTFTAAALEKAEEILKDNSTGSRHLKAYQYIVVVSDGLSTDRHVALTTARYIKSYGINVYILGVNRESDHTEFVGLASKNSLGVHGIYSQHDDDLLNTLYIETVNKVCNDCVVSSTSDIMLVTDMSRVSQGNDDIQLILSTILELVTVLDPENNNMSLGLMSYAATPYIHLKIGEIDENDTFKSTTQTLHRTFEISNVSVALEELSLSKAFSTVNGGRDVSRKVAIIISTGNWTDVQDIRWKVQELEKSGVVVLFIAIGEHANISTLTFVSQNKHNVFWVDQKDHFDSLLSVLPKTIFVSCNGTVTD